MTSQEWRATRTTRPAHTVDLYRKNGIADATIHKYNTKDGRMHTFDARKLKALDD